jgi:hypothetical protein
LEETAEEVTALGRIGLSDQNAFPQWKFVSLWMYFWLPTIRGRTLTLSLEKKHIHNRSRQKSLVAFSTKVRRDCVLFWGLLRCHLLLGTVQSHMMLACFVEVIWTEMRM